VIFPLIKDPALGQIFYRSMLIMANRSEFLKEKCKVFLEQAMEMEEEQAKKMAGLLMEDIKEME